MKASIYINYTSRSLLRGGQRTILAIFCVAVGVMAIVALQLVGYMLQNSLTSDTRDTNGGDIAITAQTVPVKSTDLSFFTQLKKASTITNYTAVTTANGTLSASGSSFQNFSVNAVDPNNYPLVSAPTFIAPTGATVSSLLTNNHVIATQNFLDNYHKKLGDTFPLYIKSQSSSGLTLHVTISGVIANTGTFAQSGNLLLVSSHDYQQAAPTLPATYNNIYVTTNSQAHTDTAVKAIEKQFQFVSTQTVADALKAQKSSIDMISKFLEIVGLLALLIGGVGIVNTMQVLLSRRKTEIAMLKTTGYRRIDLYLLFGLEAGMLGLIGGVLGAAAATGISYIVRILMQNLGMTIPFLLNPWMVLGGVAIGFITALIFGLMPIVQAANVRPLQVVREQSARRGLSSIALTVALLIVLSILFCTLAIVILNNDVLLGVEAVYGTFAFLFLLSLFCGLLILIVSKLPVPEHFNFKHLLLVLLSAAISTLVYAVLPSFGLCLFAATLLGLLAAFMPRSWKLSTKMALRNIGRQRTRTTTTVVALFIGVFTVGLVLALGEGLQAQVSTMLTQNTPYNVSVLTSGADTDTLQAHLHTVPGLSNSRTSIMVSTLPTSINGQPLQQSLPTGHVRQEVVTFLSSVEGYNLTQSVPSSSITQGRNLTPSDASTNNILLSDLLLNGGPFQMHLKPGDTITFTTSDGKTTQTATIVGFYGRTSSSSVGSVLGSTTLVQSLTSTKTSLTTITSMKIDAAKVSQALDTLGHLVPNATVRNAADIGTYISQMLNSILEMLIAIASLSLIAGVIIIANAVALAMLERRRELGILKSVGYTANTILSEVLIENGLVGALGALLAMALVTAAVTLLGNALFSLTLSVSPLIIFGLIGGSALLAMLTAALVAWGSVRIRPLEVLRYE